MEEKLFFYYTNDLHSHFDNWGKIIGYFKEKKEQHIREGQSHWLVDIGDHVDRFHPIAESMLGKANVSLLNAANYDIATIGNNEGITLDYKNLYNLYNDATFEVVCANLTSVNGDVPSWLKTSYQFVSASGVKIGVIGLTAPFNAFYNILGWHIDQPFQTLDHYIEKVADESDIVILLSHLGINEDQEIARRYPQIDVIIGGHTHHLLKDGEYINNTLLTAAGKHGNFVGEVILTWDHHFKSLVKKEGYATSIGHLPSDIETDKQLNQLQLKANKLLNQTVVTINKSLEVDWFKETFLIKELTETLLQWTEADCAMLNAGLLLEGLEAGKVSYGDVHRICPHPINPCVVEITGSELIEIVRGSFDKSLMNLQLKGFGFRGKVIGRMVFAGVDVEVKKRVDGEYQVLNVNLNNSPVVSSQTYRLATADMFTFGKLLPEIARSKSKRFFMPEFMRDLLVDTLQKQF